jgi:sulfatase modifying factor 1
MSRTISLLAASAVLLFSCPPARAVTIQWSPVGNPGNAPDTVVMLDLTTGYGAVPYAYSIGTYDVTNRQYVEFLNAKDPTGTSPLQLYNSLMSNGTQRGISYSAGNADGNKYSVMLGKGNHPVNYETWYDTIRFANWLNNGQGSGDTETGAYTLLGGTPTPSNGNNITRNAGAIVFLPSEDEWYKAAYYNPANNSYYQYPTTSNTSPTGSSPTPLPNHANILPGGPDNLTDVGAYSGTTSPFGAFDMGGNVWQWNEALISGAYRGLRGGELFQSSTELQSSFRYLDGPTFELFFVGFRVASVIPEPSSAILASLGFGGFAAWAWRRRKRLGPSRVY